jgi:hypothetical protein
MNGYETWGEFNVEGMATVAKGRATDERREREGNTIISL